VQPGLPRRSAVLGREGEDQAAAWYVARGYEVVARNWRVPAGEIDLVARRGRLVVIAEVKARSSDRFGMPVEAVVAAKQARLRRLAAAWLKQAGVRGARVRFDVVSVLAGTVEVLENAF
jgi:putative endonuclease